jgi:hypothetical protein
MHCWLIGQVPGKEIKMKRQRITIFLLLSATLFLFSTCLAVHKGSVTIQSAPEGEELSKEYKVSVFGTEVPVYIVKVAPADAERRWKAMDDKKNSADYFDTGAFAYFDLLNSTTVKVSVPVKINTAKILPSSLGIIPVIRGNSVSFPVKSPGNLTVEINGEWVRSLHIFINPPEANAPKPDDPNVIYFGPGIHEVTHLVVGDNKTLYIAGGAVVRAIIKPDEKFGISGYSGLRTYSSSIQLQGDNITVRGRGIIDASGCTTHSRNMLMVRGSNITIEGIILRDSPTWTIPVRESDNVTINNVKLIGYRANADGIDICNSRNVTIENCFIRTLDDLIVIKTPKGGKSDVKHIVAKNCVLWNQVAHALSIGAEITRDISDVLFTDCDIIHDQGREWSLRVYHTDAAQVSDVRFENIRIEESIKFISLWINKAVWTSDQDRGHIKGITFKNIHATGTPLTVELKGYDEGHTIEDVVFQDVTLNGKALTPDMVKMNSFIKNVSIQP